MKARHIALGLLLWSACGQALDRRDGSLHLRLLGVPGGVDSARVVVLADDRRFEASMSIPDDFVLRDFSAVPAGPAVVQVALMQGETVVVQHPDVAVDVRESETVAVDFAFTQASTLNVEVLGPGPLGHPSYAGALFIEVRDLAPDPDRPLEVMAEAADESLSVVMVTGDTWRVEVDPELAPKPWPAVLEVTVTVCVVGGSDCIEELVKTEIHRRVWRLWLQAPLRAEAVVVSADRLVVADATGKVHVVDINTGDLSAGPNLGSEPWRRPAVGDGLLAFASLAPELVIYDEVNLQERFRIPLSSARPSSPIWDGSRFVIADGSRLLAVDTGGQLSQIAQLPRELVADPLADSAGTVAVDLQGNVQARDSDDGLSFDLNLAAPVYAQPLRRGSQIVIAASDGSVSTFEADGQRLTPPVELGAPVAFGPLASPELGLVVVAGRRLAQITSGPPVLFDLQETVLGQPALWFGGTAVVLGLRNGRVVSADGGQLKEVTQLRGAARAPIPLPDGDLVVLDSDGEIQRLRMEGGF